MEKKALNICITGAAGQIGYAFIPLLCSGQVFGPNVKFNLKLLDIPQMEENLKGLTLEITDGAYELVQSVESGSDPNQLFKGLDIGIFIGGFPRKQGMERKQLLEQNGKIFVAQGKALEAVASKDCKILVVANPANTNCLILQQNAPKIPKQNFTCLTRLDSNRAHAQIADRIKVPFTDVKNIIIWGNHSSTQYPDVNHGNVNGVPIRDVIQDDHYLNNEFITRVQKRGAEILEARKGSSVLSAANAAKDHLRDWYLGTPSNQYISMGVYSTGKFYDIPEGIIYSFPLKCKGGFKYEIVGNLNIDEFSKEKMTITAKELLEEKSEAFGQ